MFSFCSSFFGKIFLDAMPVKSVISNFAGRTSAVKSTILNVAVLLPVNSANKNCDGRLFVISVQLQLI